MWYKYAGCTHNFSICYWCNHKFTSRLFLSNKSARVLGRCHPVTAQENALALKFMMHTCKLFLVSKQFYNVFMHVHKSTFNSIHSYIFYYPAVENAFMPLPHSICTVLKYTDITFCLYINQYTQKSLKTSGLTSVSGDTARYLRNLNILHIEK